MPGPDATVLVVDDERMLADLYADWLREEYEVVVAYDGAEALEVLDERSVDVALLDRHMHGVSGDEVLATLRNRGDDARVAMVTGVSPDADVLDLGFDDYLVKPVDEATLTAATRELVAADSTQGLRSELTALRVKRNVLEMELGTAELETDDRYAAVVDRIAELEASLDEHRSRLGWETADPVAGD